MCKPGCAIFAALVLTDLVKNYDAGSALNSRKNDSQVDPLHMNDMRTKIPLASYFVARNKTTIPLDFFSRSDRHLILNLW